MLNIIKKDIQKLHTRYLDINNTVLRFMIHNPNFSESYLYAQKQLEKNLIRLKMEIWGCFCVVPKIPIGFRKADYNDWFDFYTWRVDPETMKASFNQEYVHVDTHKKWLKRTIKDENVRLFIAEKNSKKLGTVRIDISCNNYEVSWTVNPEYRGRGIGTKMVNSMIDNLSLCTEKPITAKIKRDNTQSMFIAQSSGMELDKLINDIAHYTKTRKEEI